MEKISNAQAKFIRNNYKKVVMPTTNKYSANKNKKQHYVEDRNNVIEGLLKRFSEEVEIVVETYGQV